MRRAIIQSLEESSRYEVRPGEQHQVHQVSASIINFASQSLQGTRACLVSVGSRTLRRKALPKGDNIIFGMNANTEGGEALGSRPQRRDHDCPSNQSHDMREAGRVEAVEGGRVTAQTLRQAISLLWPHWWVGANEPDRCRHQGPRSLIQRPCLQNTNHHQAHTSLVYPQVAIDDTDNISSYYL
jgi:hypothetical protein